MQYLRAYLAGTALLSNSVTKIHLKPQNPNLNLDLNLKSLSSNPQVFQNWQHAQMQLTKRRENKAKAELANRPDKIEQASQEIIEVELSTITTKAERGL